MVADKCLISIDFWNTLYHHIGTKQYRMGILEKKIAEYCKGIEQLSASDVDYVSKNFFNVLNNVIREEWSKGNCPTNKIKVGKSYRYFRKLLNQQHCKNLIKLIEDTYLSDLRPQMAKGAADFIKNAFSKGYYLCVTSDTFVIPGRILRQILQEDGLTEYFREVIFSDEICKRKPDPSMLSWVLDKYNISKDRAVHIGDQIDTDGLLAKNIGIHFVLFQTREVQIRDNIPVKAIAHGFNELLYLIEKILSSKKVI